MMASANQQLAYTQEYSLPTELESQASIADSCASHHLTPYASYLHNLKSYVGSNKVYVGKGHTLANKFIGSAYFHSKIAPHKLLLLSNVLHVPTITRDLLSVSKFSRDNNVTFEILDEKCCVKSQDSKKTLFEGYLDDIGLYYSPKLPLELPK